MSSARSTRAGPPCPTAMTMAASPAARWTALPCSGCSRTSAAGQVDAVLVYKVDRLTRALADFARIVAIFEAAQVAFVSVTQAFDTRSPMGKLTLNVLLSFSPVRARARRRAHPRQDRRLQGAAACGWAASVPIGYRAEARTLTAGARGSSTGQRIFERYLALGSVNRLKAELDAAGIRTPERRPPQRPRQRRRRLLARQALRHARQPALRRPHPPSRPGPPRREQDELIDALEAAVSAGLIVEDLEEVDRFSFSHSLVRQTLYERPIASRRLRMHRRVAEALEISPLPVHPAELAHHYFEARAVGGADKAIVFGLQAGAAAQMAHAYEAAVEHYERVLGLLAARRTR